jgi:hypothetical protein
VRLKEAFHEAVRDVGLENAFHKMERDVGLKDSFQEAERDVFASVVWLFLACEAC